MIIICKQALCINETPIFGTNLPFLVTIISLVSRLNRDQSSTSSSSASGWSGFGSMMEAVLVGKGSVVVETVISPY